MRQSKLFTKTTKDISADEVSKNAQLLIRAGFVHKEMAGVYAYLPMGFRVLEKINDIIREEMNLAGGEEVFLTTLQRKELWEQTDRWSDEASDVWFRTALKNETELGLGWTHEEQITHIMKQFIHSYKDLPAYPYQIQTKLRNETRAKSGILRCREFLMKDLYSFSLNQEDHEIFYERMKVAYMNVFTRCGIGDRTYLTFASGGAFSKFSHEFQTITDAGEDIIYIDKSKGLAINKEVYTDEVINDLDVDRDSLIEEKAAEVGNIFSLGTRFSEPLDLTYTDQEGKDQPVIMGSYGIGPGRLMGVVVEALSDENGMVWPASIAPFQIHLVRLGEDEGVVKESEALYATLQEQGIEVLYDDRDESIGSKLKDSDLIGVPLRVVISSKSLEKGAYEVKRRTETEPIFVKKGKIKELLKILD